MKPLKIGYQQIFLPHYCEEFQPMSISETERRIVYDKIESLMGLETANYLMKLIPYPPADEIATRTDMHAQTTMLRGEMAEMRGDLAGEMATLRTDLTGQMSELRTELTGEMSELRTELKDDMSELRSDLKSDWTRLESKLTGEMSELRHDLKSDMLRLEKAVDTRFERRFSELMAATNRRLAVAMTGNAVAVVTALVM